MCRQVLRYTLYNKERSSFVDASFLHNDWWQKVRDLFHPPSEEEAEEEEEECTEGDPDCEDEEEVRPALFSQHPFSSHGKAAQNVGIKGGHDLCHRVFMST